MAASWIIGKNCDSVYGGGLGSTFWTAIPILFLLFQAVKKVRTALTGTDGGRMKDVPYMVHFTHTGPIGEK